MEIKSEIGDQPTAHELRDFLSGHEVTTVEAWTPDINGVVRGKRFPVDEFVETVSTRGFHLADSILCWTRDCGLYEDIAFSNSESGYPDLTATPLLSTLALTPWRRGGAAVLCQVTTLEGDPIEVDPRTVLARQVEQLVTAGLRPKAALELEFYLLTEEGVPASKGNDCYAFVLPAAIERFLERTEELKTFGLPVEATETEWGTAQLEITMRPTDAMVAADQAVMFKAAVKNIAHSILLTATFMPKPFRDQPGSGMHVNQSLRDASGENVFDRSRGDSIIRDHYLGGLVATGADFFLLGSPTVNSYKRITPGSFAPTTITWSKTSRTAAIRALFDRGDSESRIECRMPGADANPYLALSASLAGGLYGIRNTSSPPTELRGSAYRVQDEELMLPTTLPQAIHRFSESPSSREAFGEAFVAHYSTLTRHEASEFAAAVTDWEFRKYLHYA